VSTDLHENATLAPTEVVLLDCNQFAPGPGRNYDSGFAPFERWQPVSSNSASQTAWVAAFLALEQAGDLTLEVHPK